MLFESGKLEKLLENLGSLEILEMVLASIPEIQIPIFCIEK